MKITIAYIDGEGVMRATCVFFRGQATVPSLNLPNAFVGGGSSCVQVLRPGIYASGSYPCKGRLPLRLVWNRKAYKNRLKTKPFLRVVATTPGLSRHSTLQFLPPHDNLLHG